MCMKANKWSGGVLALLLWAVLALPVARAQQPTQLVAEMQAKFPGEKAVYLDYRTDLTLEAKGDSVLVLVNRGIEPVSFALPVLQGRDAWTVRIDTRTASGLPGHDSAQATYEVGGRSLVILTQPCSMD